MNFANRGMKTDEKPGREDFGGYLSFEAAGIGTGL